ncbi:hypothetical protein MIMGU_mgv1a020682mg [Erythranthe guttata]|uniref:Uncharacterized protein n=1 Tax=Erythranthe guttata TaxID=4155 RepID=A0A022R1K2_ERYGU|nr:hypothetical protein MIMGU_mgv1a020682mg [Erythranthe guttata]
MARHNLLFLKHHQLSISHISFGIGTFLLCAFTLFMCVNHSRRWRKWKSCYGYRNQQNPVIQHNHEDIIGYNYGEDIEPSTYSGDVSSVWKKNILMGGKCQLPDFSGVIIYDSTGNRVPPAKTLPALTWK